ncbi:MAG: putative nucleic acid-binding protein [Candidatus Latescibacterota bacterium]
MKFLLDTCVISEFTKKRPTARVTKWMNQQDEFSLYLSTITIGELYKGIAKLPDGQKKQDLQSWVATDLTRKFTGRILNVNQEVAQRWGILSANAEKIGRPVPILDGLLAATAQAFGLIFVTRNISHVEITGISILNPWTT